MAKPSVNDKGQGLLELALVIPVLLLIAVGLLDLGRAFFSLIVINNSAREGARYLMMHPDDKSNAYAGTRLAARMEARNSIITLTDGDIDVTYCRDLANEGICESGFPVRVRVTFIFRPIMRLLLPGSMNFSRSVEMMVP